MSKHTPGPWIVEPVPYDSSRFYIRGSNTKGQILGFGKGAVAHIPQSTVNPMEANANLIAAAPDLLAALEGLMSCYIDLLDEDQVAAAQNAKSAIAKAKGES